MLVAFAKLFLRSFLPFVSSLFLPSFIPLLLFWCQLAASSWRVCSLVDRQVLDRSPRPAVQQPCPCARPGRTNFKTTSNKTLPTTILKMFKFCFEVVLKFWPSDTAYTWRLTADHDLFNFLYRVFSQKFFWSFSFTSNGHCSSSSQRICMKIWGNDQWVPLYLFQASKRESGHLF